MLFARALCLLSLSLGMHGACVGQERSKADQVTPKEVAKELRGNYRIISGERGGEPISPARLSDVSVRISDKVISTHDRDKKQVFGAEFRLEPSESAAMWKIKMTSTMTPVGEVGAQSEGLIEVKENRVRLIYALPGGEPPLRFKTKAVQQMFVLERLSVEAATPAVSEGKPKP